MIKILAAGALAASFATCANAACTPIHFAPGTSSATVKGMAPSDEPFACYTLATGTGQTATLKLTQQNGDTAFNVTDVVDNRDDYTFKTQAKTYHIDVYQMTTNRRDAPFTLQVSVK